MMKRERHSVSLFVTLPAAVIDFADLSLSDFGLSVGQNGLSPLKLMCQEHRWWVAGGGTGHLVRWDGEVPPDISKTGTAGGRNTEPVLSTRLQNRRTFPS
jgi:hypothetical protein